jgi:hypothetical protein
MDASVNFPSNLPNYFPNIPLFLTIQQQQRAADNRADSTTLLLPFLLLLKSSGNNAISNLLPCSLQSRNTTTNYLLHSAVLPITD